MTKKLSIVIPAYNEHDMIPIAYKAISDTISQLNIDYEIIFVDDGSNDDTFEAIQNLHNEIGTSVRGISFSRNFGKEAALFAGLKEASGDGCLVMDCDLQHPVSTIPEMVSLWLEGYEVIEGIKASRGHESLLYRFMSKLFYTMITQSSKLNLENASDFVLLDRVAIDSLLEMPEKAPFFRGLSRWIGFKTAQVTFEVADRTIGTSKWSTRQLIKYAIHNIIIFSSEPLQLVTVLGLLFIFASVFVAGEALYRYFTGTALGGFTTVIILILLSSGFIMISLGIIGIYISQIYDEVKARPRYIISKKI